MHASDTPIVKDLVLIGGGHAHVGVLRMFGMKPLPGLRLTLVTRDIHTPYSGMLPGYIAGHYGYDDCHIDLGPLARFAKARLIHAPASGLDLDARQVLFDERPPLPYDLLSINIGSRPHQSGIPGVVEHAIPVKPIDQFLRHWDALQARALGGQGRFAICVVGGGAGGVELALSVQHKLRRLLHEQGRDPQQLRVTLATAGPDILETHSAGVRRRFNRIMAERDLLVRKGCAVTEVTASTVVLEGGERIPADAVLWATHASSAAWPGAGGLAVDAGGFIRVDEQLRSVSHAEVFAAGDTVAMPDPRPKSGVFAVRQGPVLGYNLRAAAQGRRLRAYKPQRNFLGLISTGDPYAVASRGGWSAQGGWLWTWKDHIDRRFMRRFNELPEMPTKPVPDIPRGMADAEASATLQSPAMRCGGCGAKVGATVLERVMRRLPSAAHEDVSVGLAQPDDAVVLNVPPGKQLTQSVDYFRAFIDDAYTFGAIAANHALGDLFAMGAEPQSALAVATVPFATEERVEQTLYELLAGALSQLHPVGAVLAGGHSSEGAELAFGLSVNGLVGPEGFWRKSGLRPGDALILTKPVGTGALMAADMRGKAKGRWVDGAIRSMLQSSAAAASVLRRHGASACTDVTGFGLVGHLLEMARASGVAVNLEPGAIPALDGALDCIEQGITSTLQPQNLRLRRALLGGAEQVDASRFALLFDPQTAGGLLAGVPAESAQACVKELVEAGYAAACIVGEVDSVSDAEECIRVL